jgi:hypothetical protein
MGRAYLPLFYDFFNQRSTWFRPVLPVAVDQAGGSALPTLASRLSVHHGLWLVRAHRVPGMDDADVPSVGQVLRMATTGGAMTTPFGGHIGTHSVGKAADPVLIDWDKLAYPYLDPGISILEAVVQQDGRFTRVDRDAALRELHQSLERPLADDEVERRQMSKALLPCVRRFHAGYFDPETHLP